MRGNRTFTKLIVIFWATVLLICGFGEAAPFTVKAAAFDLSEDESTFPVGDLPYVPENEEREAIASDFSTNRLIKNTGLSSVDHGYYYGKLDNDIKKDLYDGMYIAADSSRRLAYGKQLPNGNSEAAVSAVACNFYTGTKSRIKYYTGSSKECTETVNEAVEALCYDHMANVEYYMCEAKIYEFKSGGTYKDYVIMKPYTSADYDSMNLAIKAKAKYYAQQIKTAGLVSSSNPAETVLNAHDFFLTKVSFNIPVSNNSGNSGYYNNAHTAYGALCEGSAVCDGYAIGYALLLKELGIESRVVTGNIFYSGKSGGHAWSMVKIENDWYEQDPTWDDTNDLITHSFYNKTTKQYSDGINGYRHVRLHPYTGILIDGAYGTKYAYNENGGFVWLSNRENVGGVYDANTAVESEDSETVADIIKEENGITYRLSAEGKAIVCGADTDNRTVIQIPDTVAFGEKNYPVTEIADGVFAGNSKIRQIKLGKNVEIIGKNAFKNCRNLKILDMSEAKLLSIGKSAVSGCKKLTILRINGNNLKKIGTKAFKNTGKNIRVFIYAKNMKVYKNVVKKLNASGLKEAGFKYKRKK
jgi:hypothetical protein